MKKPVFIALLSAALSGSFSLPAGAVDHNNLDAGRPLDFDDADSIAYREKAFEIGAAIVKPKNGKTGVEGSAEFLYGFAKNSHLSLDIDPRYASENGAGRRFDVGDVGIGLFHSLNREYGNTPALAIRADAYLPTGRDSEGVDFRVRGIASKHLGQYDRVHLNLDLTVNNSAAPGERKMQPGVVLGYSRPLGYPTRFDRTLVAQLGYRANPQSGASGITNIGIGLRQQITVRSVLDIGLTSDIAGGAPGGANREGLKLVAGYSTQF